MAKLQEVPAVKLRIYELLEPARGEDRASTYVDVFIISLIVLNIIALILETVPVIGARWSGFFYGFEVVSVGIFTIEYLLRIWTCTLRPEYASTVRGRFRFALTPMLIIDLVAILPFYLPLFGLDLRFMRALRLFRLFRIAKFGRYSIAMQTLGRVVRAKKEELVITFSVLLVLLLLASSFMYFFEREAQPETFSSIPATMWWAIVTLTTVGYGDTFPVTPLGRVFGAVTAILGIGMFALPTGILGSAFLEEIEKAKQEPAVCPHCGRRIDPS